MSFFSGFFSKRRSLPSSPKEDLFDDEFQRKLEGLALASKRMFAGKMRAERRTKKSGSGIEFSDHRNYEPGDDFRALDWNVYQRFDRLLLRLNEEEEDLSVYFVIDTSLSMSFGDGEKLRYAKKLAAALAYIGLTNLDRVSVVEAKNKLVSRMPETRGKSRIFRVFHYLRGLQGGEQTNLEASLKSFVAQNKRKGICVLITDFYDQGGFERGLNVLRYNRFEPFVIHITDEEEAKPTLNGDVLLYDCENGNEREVTVTPKIIEKYIQSYRAYLLEIEHFCVGHRVPYVRADIRVAFEDQALTILKRGGFLR